MTVFIGDVHGKYGAYETIMKHNKNTIQIGDMGVGFRRYDGWNAGSYYPNPPYDKMVEGGHRFIRGNHDNPSVCSRHTQWIADGSVEGEMMFVGGAYSVDKDFRVEDFSWWPDEELSHKDFELVQETFKKHKPRIMVTHDCPAEVVPAIHTKSLFGMSRTQHYLQECFAAHQPDIWIFGHHHKSFRYKINGTLFICLNELETTDI